MRFENVSFHYGRDAGVIEGLNFTIRPGEKVGLVGTSGAGKTTITALLLRLHDLEGGRILIDGQDIAAVTQDSLQTAHRRRDAGHVAPAPVDPGEHLLR